MAIKRLPAEATRITASIVVNKKLAPYMKKWFRDTKLPNEDIDSFILRMLRQRVMQWYARGERHKQAVDMRDKFVIAEEALSADEALIIEELDGGGGGAAGANLEVVVRAPAPAPDPDILI